MEIVKTEDGGNINITLLENEKEVAKAKCYLENTPELEGKKVGAIGELEITENEYGINLLNECEKVFKEKNIQTVIAPMNGNTWKQYRTLKSTNNEPEFLLEKVSPVEYNEILKQAGFEECNTYTSNKGKIKDAYTSEVVEFAKEMLQQENIEIRKFKKENAIADLTKIYNVSIKSFKRNPFYTDIDKENFLGQYTQYLDLIDDDFVWIAEKEGKEIGFVFCIPNYNELKLHGKMQTLILKTIAVLPEYESFAIGNIMLENVAKIAENKGYTDWIFAFMHSTNTSQKMAKRNKAEVIREYALYRKDV